MKRKSLFIALFAVATVVLLAATALAAKPTNPGKPTPTTTTTVVTSTTVPGYWTCQARIDNGAVWPLGDYDDELEIYTGDGPLLCVDVIADHRDVTDWSVEWFGTATKDTVKGLKLVFEEEVHGTVFDEIVVHDTTETWKASWSDPVQNLVFVAMPHSGDKWIGSMTFTITPLSGGHDG